MGYTSVSGEGGGGDIFWVPKFLVKTIKQLICNKNTKESNDFPKPRTNQNQF